MLRSELDPTMQEHFDKYENLAYRISIPALRSVQPFTRQEVRKAMETDLHLNNLSLRRWDACHGAVLAMLHGTGIKSWSLGDTVCVLKHVARHHYA